MSSASRPALLRSPWARVLGVLALGVTVLAVNPSADAGQHVGLRGSAVSGLTRPQWPHRMCAKQSGHRITTTTATHYDDFVAEPGVAPPRLTAKQAYANFVELYGHQRRAERRATQVRYGVITIDDGGTVGSGTQLGMEPDVRRIRGWMITNCAAPTRPADVFTEPGRPGVLIYALADRAKPFSLGWSYEYLGDDGTTYGTGGSSIIVGPQYAMPPFESTRYASVPWTLAKRSASGSKVLVRYLQLRCYSLDHVIVDQDVNSHGASRISVVLSTGPNGTCATPSAISPYMEATAVDEVFGPIQHGQIGPLTYSFTPTCRTTDPQRGSRAACVGQPGP